VPELPNPDQTLPECQSAADTLNETHDQCLLPYEGKAKTLCKAYR